MYTPPSIVAHSYSLRVYGGWRCMVVGVYSARVFHMCTCVHLTLSFCPLPVLSLLLCSLFNSPTTALFSLYSLGSNFCSPPLSGSSSLNLPPLDLLLCCCESGNTIALSSHDLAVNHNQRSWYGLAANHNQQPWCYERVLVACYVL